MNNNLGDILDKKDTSANFLVLGSGTTVGKYIENLKKFIVKQNCLVIGINNVHPDIFPHFHFFTNTKRFQKYYKNVKDESALIISNNINVEYDFLDDYIQLNRPYYRIQYHDFVFDGVYKKPSIVTDTIMGSFRTAGVLAIYLCKLLGGIEIYVAGMDGYGYNINQQHYYVDKDDDDTEQSAKEKDIVINRCLDLVAEKVNFGIITPTIYKKHKNYHYWKDFR